MVLFLLITQFKIFKNIFMKEVYEVKDLVLISILFTFLAIFGTYNGIYYLGSIVNTRIISIVSSGILFGPIVSIPAGIISGLHRYIIDINGITSIPCFVSSILAGIISGFVHNKIQKKNRAVFGVIIGVISESVTIILIYLISTPHDIALTIVRDIYLPLIVGQVGVAFVVSIVDGIEKNKKEIEDRKKSEIKALQRQINPHFIFNSLNTITSFIRFNPQRARELIINLSNYLRHNLEFNDELIDIEKEINQVKSYVEIEKARFGDLLNVVYDIDDVNIKIPSLVIQPLVENSIVHGILKGDRKNTGVVKISIKDLGENVKISIEDNGIGISENIIEKIYHDNMPKNKIGLYNVHSRLKLVYHKGLKIEKLNRGTLIEFEVGG